MIQFFQNIDRSKLWYSIILIFLLVPTYFIHTQKYPDWGDDFAQYVYQSQQINSPSETYKQVLNIEEYSSSKRSVFFSIALSPISPTVKIQQYVNLNSVFYILAALCFFLFLSNYFSPVISICGALCMFYNFLFLRLKSEVIPEFLFIAFYLFILYLFFNQKKWTKYLIPFLSALLFSIRFIGLAMLLGYIIDLLFSKGKTIKEKVIDISISGLFFIVPIVLINTFFLRGIDNREVALYGGHLFGNFEIGIFFKNAAVYISYIVFFFEQEIPFWINKIITLLVFSFFIIGFFNALKNKRGFMEYFFIIYFLFIISYPTNNDTIRYLIPIIPLFVYYAISGMNVSLKRFNIKYSSLFITACLIIVCLSNSKTVWLAMKNQNNYYGPYEPSVLVDFEKVKEIVPEQQSIAFAKPFVANLLCDRHSYFIGENNFADVLGKADYYLSPKSSIHELYPKSKKISLLRGDTTELINFYLVKLK